MRNLMIVALVAYFASSNAFTFDPRIVDGQKATIGQFPYYAFLYINHPENKSAACGASLLSDEWLLTAAHCLSGGERVKIVLGESQLEELEPGVIGITVESDGFHIHPDYNPQAALNDIALIRMPQKVIFTNNIKPVSLPEDCAEPTIADVVVAGHGRTSDAGDVSLQLNYAHLTTIPLNLCRRVFPIISNRKSVICAMSTEPGLQSVCSGDSGGPMVTLSNPTLIGVSCFVRKEGCETRLPQGFTNVYSHLNWIKDVTGLDLPHCSSAPLYFTSQIVVLIALLLCTVL